MEEKKSYKGQLGGKRPGAGRKKGTSSIIADRARQAAMEIIEKELKPILLASIALAKGVFVEGEDGEVYQTKPDVNAIKHLIDQIIGKPKESVDMNIGGEIKLSDLLGKGALDKKK